MSADCFNCQVLLEQIPIFMRKPLISPAVKRKAARFFKRGRTITFLVGFATRLQAIVLRPSNGLQKNLPQKKLVLYRNGLLIFGKLEPQGAHGQGAVLGDVASELDKVVMQDDVTQVNISRQDSFNLGTVTPDLVWATAAVWPLASEALWIVWHGTRGNRGVACAAPMGPVDWT